VDGLEIFRLHGEPCDAWERLKALTGVSDHVLHEHGAAEGALGHIFFIRALEDRIDVTGPRLLQLRDHILDPEKTGRNGSGP